MRLVTFKALATEKGVTYSRVHLYRLIEAGKFPRPIVVGAARVAWIESEIDQWISDRMAEREAA